MDELTEQDRIILAHVLANYEELSRRVDMDEAFALLMNMPDLDVLEVIERWKQHMADEISTDELMARWANDKARHDTYPCTVISARYGGVYEGGMWLAFHCYPDQIPSAATDDDVTCSMWWMDQDSEETVHMIRDWGKMVPLLVGKGESPSAAVAALNTLIQEGKQE